MKFRQRFNEHLASYWWVYLFVSSCFVAGLIFGSWGVKSLDGIQASSLLSFLDQGLTQQNGSIDFDAMARQALIKSLSSLFKISILGLTIFGIPFVLAIIFTRGFLLGFTIVFLLMQKGWEGILLALFVIIPPNLLYLPAYLLAAVSSINMSVYLFKGRSETGQYSFYRHLFSYVVVMFLLAILMAAAAIIEGYLSPIFLELVENTV